MPTGDHGDHMFASRKVAELILTAQYYGALRRLGLISAQQQPVEVIGKLDGVINWV